MSKLGMLAAGAVGYVLGARAGRERYDQIVAASQRLWSNPKVQEASQQAQLYAREKGPDIGEKVADVAVDAAKTAAAKVADVVSSDGPSTSSASNGSTTKKAAAKKTTAKKSTAKKSPAKKTTAKKSTTDS